MTAPTAAELDSRAQDYYALKEALVRATETAAAARTSLDTLKQELIETVREFGSAHAEKSKILHGVTQEMVATFGCSVSIDGAAVERFRVALAESAQSRLAGKIFDKTVRYSLVPGSGPIIRGSKLSKPLLALYAQCEVISPRAPILSVRQKAA